MHRKNSFYESRITVVFAFICLFIIIILSIDLTQRLNEESKLREEESSRAADARSALERVQQSLVDARQQSEALTGEREALQKTVTDLEESAGKLAEISQSNEALEANLSEMKEKCDELRASVSTLAEEKATLETRVEELSHAEEEAEADTAEVVRARRHELFSFSVKLTWGTSVEVLVSLTVMIYFIARCPCLHKVCMYS